MKNLLKSSDRRRLEIAEILFDQEDWVTLDYLASKVHSSKRILKYDFVNFEETFNDFSIKTSHQGVRLVFHQNKGFKTLYNNVLEQSISFRLLETIFLNETYSTPELADELFISPSTLYRLIDHSNKVTNSYGFEIQTNPCQLVGDEEKIRHFFIKYFYEKYTRLDWPHKSEEAEALDNLLFFFIDFTQTPIDFAYYNIFKLITIVNLLRYKNGHFIHIDTNKINFSEIMSDLTQHSKTFKYFEKTLNLEINNEFIHQIFTPFIQKGYSLTLDRLNKKVLENKK